VKKTDSDQAGETRGSRRHDGFGRGHPPSGPTYLSCSGRCSGEREEKVGTPRHLKGGGEQRDEIKKTRRGWGNKNFI